MLSQLHEIQNLNNISAPSMTTLLENGQILFCPNDGFLVENHENELLNDCILAPKKKNISFDYIKNEIQGIQNSLKKTPVNDLTMNMMKRYAEYARHLVDTLCPSYSEHLIWGRTSYRPMEIKNRSTSKRQDDTKLHVDAFSATPVNGLRILRVFCNINPHQKPRIWNVGEDFSEVLATFASRIPDYNKKFAKMMYHMGLTKKVRSAYDHYMLNLHDLMKLDNHYQNSVAKENIQFPSQSTWMVFTDQVSHAALSGKFLLEQTFYLPVHAMKNPELSPLKRLQAQWNNIPMQTN